MVAEAGQRIPGLEGAYNFRDLGGLPTDDGKRTVSGAIFRSDALEQLTGDDVHTLCEVIGVGSVIDLRAHVETAGTRPSWARDTTLDFVSLPLDDAWTDWGTLDDEGRRTLLARKYLSYLDAAAQNVVTAVELIAENARKRRPTIFHCAVGKDRTGVLTAILLGVLGVTREAIVADYLVTQGNMGRLLERLKQSELYRKRVETNPAEVYLAEEHTITTFLDALDERFDGPAAWTLSHGLGEATVDGLRENLLETSTGEGGDR